MQQCRSENTLEGTQFAGRELYILLSDRCNFTCSHCLNSSGPQATRWTPNEDSILELADEINRSSDIQTLHFSGGEPTLFLPQIKQLLSLIQHPREVVMTTNGWFVDRSLRLLDEFSLRELIISHDRFHAPYLTVDKLIPLVRHLQERGTSVSFNFVYSEISELSYLAELQAVGVEVHISRMIRSGRAQSAPHWFDKNSIHETCPSLVPEQRRSPHLEKTIYISQKGFTPCCGPLVFDEKVNPEFAFSADLSHYNSNPLLAELRRGPFQEQAMRSGLDLSQARVQSSCDACALLYGSAGPGLPSVRELAQSKETYYPFTGALSQEHEKLLLQCFVVGYTQTLDPERLKSQGVSEILTPGEIAASAIEKSDHASLVDFVRSNYYTNYPEHYSSRALQEFSDFCPEYLSWPSVRGVIYRKRGEIVGTLFTHLYDPHPALKVPTLHIGYWGYDRSCISRDEARWIKKNWLTSLAHWSEGCRAIDASFDCFNTSALRFAESVGFARRMLRLDRKEGKSS